MPRRCIACDDRGQARKHHPVKRPKPAIQLVIQKRRDVESQHHGKVASTHPAMIARSFTAYHYRRAKEHCGKSRQQMDKSKRVALQVLNHSKSFNIC